MVVRVEFYVGSMPFEDLCKQVHEVFSKDDVLVAAKTRDEERHAILISNSECGATMMRLKYGCVKDVKCEEF
jgi:hypothetical protein